MCHAGVISRVDASPSRLRHCRDGKKKKPRRISQSFKLLLDLVRRVPYKEVIALRLNIAGVLETTYWIRHTSALSNINGVLHL